MDKLKMHSLDGVARNIERIGKLFPNTITEVIRDGKVEHAIDFDVLRQELSGTIVEGREERYQFTWPDKKKAMLAANAPITATLRPVMADSVGRDGTPGGFDSENLYIEGDNLEVLKLLQETYLGKVKMIYIDPPYNTGNDFVYEDDFSQSVDEYMENSGQYDEEGNRMVTNTESNGRFHTDWLNMIYPRLKLAKDLLAEDGAIFISLDDKETGNMRKICDEIFGAVNFRSDISWQKRYTRSNNTVDFTTVIEHIFVYSKSSQFVVNLLPRTEEADSRYMNPDNDPRGVWKGASFLNPATPAQRPNLCYSIVNPNTGEVTNPTTHAWRRSKEVFDELLKDNRLYWGIDGTSALPSIKMYLSESRGLTPINFWEHNYAGNTDNGTADLLDLFGIKAFNNPKPVQLIIRVLEHVTQNVENDIVLDFFSGSATTAHAVMKLNAEDGGHRKFIMVQLPERCEEGSEAARAGYKNICEIGKERIRRAGRKIKEEAGLTASADLDIGFRCLRLDESNMQQVYYTPDEVVQQDLFKQVDNVKPDRTPEDLLFQVMLDLGVLLSSPIEVKEIAGKKVFNVADGFLLACFDTDATDETVRAIAQMKPCYAVFRDSSMANDSVATNFDEIFKSYSPDTVRKVL